MKSYNYSVFYKEELKHLSYECETCADSIDEIKEEIESADDFIDIDYYEIFSEDGSEHYEWERK